MACGWLAVNPDDETQIIASGSRLCGNKGTSNLAEYRGLIVGLQGSLKAGIDTIHIIGDSQLIIKQVTGAFKINKSELHAHCDCVHELLRNFISYSIKWVPRRENQRADSLVNKAFDKKNRKRSRN